MGPLILLSCILIQMCLGGLYAWSSFVPALTGSHGLSTAETQVIFGALIAVFTVTMVLAGRGLGRRGPRVFSGAAGVLFAAGYLIASASGGAFLFLLLGIGIVGGAATGLGYVSALTTCMRWFPAHRGLVAGLAVGGFGGGAVLLAALTETLFAQGLDVLAVFRWVGVCYGAAILLAALPLRFPEPEGADQHGLSPLLPPVLHDLFFWALVVGMFFGTLAGLLVIANLKPLALSRGISSGWAAAAISAFAVGNSVGRIIWGWISDRLGIRTIPLSLAFLALTLFGLLPEEGRATALVAVSAAIGFGFGSCFVVYAAQVAARYGSHRVATVYPLVFLAYGVSGLAGPLLGGWLYDITESYLLATWISIGALIGGLLGSRWLLYRSKSSAPPTSVATPSHDDEHPGALRPCGITVTARDATEP